MSVGVAAVVAGIFGAIIGSFLNVVAYRLPRKESLMSPSFGLPLVRHADQALRQRARPGLVVAAGPLPRMRRFDLDPLPAGGARDRPAVGRVRAALRLRHRRVLPIVFVTLLVPITLIDLDHHIIPNVLSGIGAVAAIVLVLIFDSDSIVEHLIAAVAAGGFFLLAAIVYPAGMGMGDVKLAAVMGLFLGRAVAPAIFAALIAGTVVGGLVMARFGMQEGRKKGIPFGPWLAFGSLVGLFAGDDLVDWYLDTFT